MRTRSRPAEARDLRNDVSWGLAKGFTMAILLSTYATVQRVINGPGPFARLHSTYPRALLLYLVLGVICGVLLGLLRPLTRTRMGSVLAGAVVGAALCWCVGVIAVGLAEATRGYFIAILLSVGAGAGAFYVILDLILHPSPPDAVKGEPSP